ncbi:hypothetical protein BKA62DRAFT_299377 [Auriculariales sp. MPI-PUGE-AT-0066]|nr:hypothetical protein BKA62DRAFT_299377 [Auriculariales sp. MPI-PUGE-AT-0066]
MQPSDRPSHVTYFVIIVKLRQILAFAMRTIVRDQTAHFHCHQSDGPLQYSINHAKSLPQHVRQHWELMMLAEMDASLTRWGQSVPHHLRWDTKQPDGIWSRQSISLWCGYNYMKIFLHAQFIQLPY